MQKLDKSKLVMNLSKRYKLVPFLDKALKEFDEEWAYKYEVKSHDDAWHPSGDCTPPASALYLAATGQSTKAFNLDGGLNKHFQVGHFWHQLLQHIVLNKLELCEPESIERRGMRAWKIEEGHDEKNARVVPYGWATGSGDIAPLVLPSGWQGIVDFKTMNGRTAAAGKVPSMFADKYEAQINIYMDFFDEEKALIVGINKDAPHEFLEFEYERNQPLINGIYAKWEFVSECLEIGHCPDQEDDDMFILPFRGPVAA